jgi:glycosyltransferase involved in cell wall biosynthesis
VRICFIGDAATIHTQRWVSWFAAENEVMLISTTTAESTAPYAVVHLPTASAPGLRLLRSVAVVRRLVTSFRPDVLHAHYINEAGWFGAASRWRPLVVTTWGSDVYRAPLESPLARRLNPWALRRADWVTCDSVDQSRAIRSWGVRGDRVSVIGWGVDRREFRLGVDGSAMRDGLGIPPDATVLLSPRQWYDNSNILAVVAAHQHLPEHVYLVLKRSESASEHGAAEGVERAIAASQARERIRVMGRIDAGELPALYAAADVVVSLCTTDGTPVSLLEAMALGRPVVALRTPSVAEWVTSPGGVLVESLDPDEIASAIVALVSDAGARDRAAAHNTAVIATRADRDVEFDRMASIYARLAKSRAGKA